jgi:hypothetical protein
MIAFALWVAAPAQFSINQGNPTSGVSQTDIGVYFQDDWRIRPTFTFKLWNPVRNQTNINSNFNSPPRVFLRLVTGERPILPGLQRW